jgi:hypothetical protein
MILAQGIPPVSILVVVLYLPFAVPVTFVSALLSLALTFSAARFRPTFRYICLSSLIASILNGVLVVYFIYTDRQPLSADVSDVFWLFLMIVTFILSVIGSWRSSLQIPYLSPPDRDRKTQSSREK